jgi:hypothetical protein
MILCEQMSFDGIEARAEHRGHRVCSVAGMAADPGAVKRRGPRR